jgi:hypothetical protein
MSHESDKRVLKFQQVLMFAKYVSILADQRVGQIMGLHDLHTQTWRDSSRNEVHRNFYR